MSTETTNKKIKIDNGTTFGRAYTDKAVDELLKNADKSYKSVVTIELTDEQLGTMGEGSISFTEEQANIMKADGVSTVVFTHGGESLFKFALSKANYDSAPLYTLSCCEMMTPETPSLITIGASDLTKNLPINISLLPHQYISDVIFSTDSKGITFMSNEGESRKELYFDKVNNSDIFKVDESKVKNYYAPETINSSATPKILTSKSGTFEWSDLSEAGTSVTIRRW